MQGNLSTCTRPPARSWTPLPPMRVAIFKSLPVRLAGLILALGGLSLLVLTELNRRAVERILFEQSEVQAMLATNAVVEGLDGVIGGVERLARLVARDLEERAPTRAELERLSRVVLLDQPQIYGFAIALDPGAPEARAGAAVYRSQVAARFVSFDLTSPARAFWDRDWYRETADKGLSSWSEPFFDRDGSERNVIRLSVPVWRREGDKRRVAGAVSAVVELDWLRRLANSNEFSETSFTIVFSRTGRIVIHPRDNYVITETIDTLAEKTNSPALAEMRQMVVARKQGSMRYQEPLTGRRVHANYKPARTAGWGVIFGHDEAEFLRPQNEFRRLSALYLVAALLLLAGIVIGVTRRALRPLGPLALASDEIARGNLDCEVPATRRADEVGRLASAFRAMRDALKAQNLERRWAGQALAHQLKYNQLIIDSIGELVFVLTKSLSVTRINPAVTRFAGHAPADVVRAPVLRILSLAPSTAGGEAVSLAEALRAGRSLHDVGAELRTKTGGVLRVRLAFAPLTDENKVVGAVVTLRIDEADLPQNA